MIKTIIRGGEANLVSHIKIRTQTEDDNTTLRRILRPKTDEVTRGWKNFTSSFIVLLTTKCY